MNGDWSVMLDADVLVLGCGNTLFGDDGLGPYVMQALAADENMPENAVFVDAGTSLRTLLTDLVLMQCKPRRLIILDVVQQPGREPGSIVQENLDAHGNSDPAGGFLHHAPTWGLLRKLRDEMGSEVMVMTVQAACIPELMQAGLSPELQSAFPLILDHVRNAVSLNTHEML